MSGPHGRSGHDRRSGNDRRAGADPPAGRAVNLTIVIPAFNEANRLAEGIRRFDAAVADGAIDVEETELLLIDDGSTDDTAAIAAKVLAPFPHRRVIRRDVNGGKGAAVRTGVAAASGSSIAFMDADMAIDPRAVPLLLDGLADHDIAVGSRALPDSMVETTYAARSLMGHVFNRMVTAGTGLGLRDTQCGFKAFKAPVARLLFQLVGIERFAFDFELLLRAHRLGLGIIEVPVQWKHVAGSTIHPLPDSLGMLSDAVRSRLGLMPAPSVPAVVVTGAPEGTETLLGRIGEVLDGTEDGDTACVVPTGGGATVLFPLTLPDQVAESWAALRAELEPLQVTRRTATFDHLVSLGPLAGRVLAPPDGRAP